MTNVSEIEKAVAEPPPKEFAQFRAWFQGFEAERFDRRIAQDSSAGRLDRLADEALAEFRSGGARELACLGQELPIFELTTEDQQAVARSRGAWARGEVASDKQIRAIWSKHGL